MKDTIKKDKKIRKIKWLEKDLILVGETSGPIATEEQYVKGETSLAHLYPDGKILSYGEQVGTKDDITFEEFIDLKQDIEAVENTIKWLLRVLAEKGNI